MDRLVTVDQFNAFAVNRVGLGGHPFPLSLSVSFSDSVLLIHGTASKAVDLVDVLVQSAGTRALVFNLGQVTWFDVEDPQRVLGLAEIAEHQGVPAVVHDAGWAAAARPLRSDLLDVEWSDLRRLLEDWSSYDIEIVATDGQADVEELLLAANTWQAVDPPLIATVPGASARLHVHDDCYFDVEARDPDIPARLLSKLLAMLAGSAIHGRGDGRTTLAAPPTEVVQALLAQATTWVGTVLAIQHDGVRIGSAPAEWTLADALPDEWTTTVTYLRQAWEIL